MRSSMPDLARSLAASGPQIVRRLWSPTMPFWRCSNTSAGLPGITLDDKQEKIFFDTTGDLSPALESFYARYLAEDIDSFAFSHDYATGFYTMLDALRSTPGQWAKGHVTGPISLGLTVTDQDLRASLYNAMPVDGARTLAAFMRSFAASHA